MVTSEAHCTRRRYRIADDTDDAIIAQYCRRTMQRRNERQRFLYKMKSMRDGKRQLKMERIEQHSRRRRNLLEFTLYHMTEHGVAYTGNNDLLRYMVKHIYTPNDKGCHVNTVCISEYKREANMEARLCDLKNLRERDPATFSIEWKKFQ